MKRASCVTLTRSVARWRRSSDDRSRRRDACRRQEPVDVVRARWRLSTMSVPRDRSAHLAPLLFLCEKYSERGNSPPSRSPFSGRMENGAAGRVTDVQLRLLNGELAEHAPCSTIQLLHLHEGRHQFSFVSRLDNCKKYRTNLDTTQRISLRLHGRTWGHRVAMVFHSLLKHIMNRNRNSL